MIKKFLATSLILFLLLSCTSTHKTYSYKPKTSAAKNIIFMIVDGMGFEYVKAAHIYNGQKPMSFERFHCKTSVTTCAYEGASADGHCDSHSSHITDSAAAATAIATGFKVSNGVISRRLPGKDNDIESILEYAKTKNKSTGVIATKLFTDATPAAFISHVKDRGDTEEILTDIFSQSLPNVVFGSDNDKHVAAAQKAILPYNFAKNTSELRSLARSINDGPSCHGSDCPHIYGGFGYHEAILGSYNDKQGLPLAISDKKAREAAGVPTLSEMTDAALKILSKNENGFFLMVESSMPDMIGHYNKKIDSTPGSPSAIATLVSEMMEVETTAKVLEKFVKDNPDTLLVLTADHETGGLVVEEDKSACLGQERCIPSVRWTSLPYDDKPFTAARHSGVDVPLYAIGHGAERFCRAQKINNTDIRNLALAP